MNQSKNEQPTYTSSERAAANERRKARLERTKLVGKIVLGAIGIVGIGSEGIALASAHAAAPHEQVQVADGITYTVEQTGIDSTLYGISGDAYPNINVQDAVSDIKTVNKDVDFNEGLQAGQQLKMPAEVDGVHVVPQFEEPGK